MASGVLAHGQIAGTTLTTLLTVGTSTAITVVTFVLTNTGTSKIDVDVYVNLSTTDRLLTTITLPAGVGKAKPVNLALGTYSQLDSIKLQGDGGTFNYFLTGRTDNV